MVSSRVRQHKQRGFSLIELMMAITISSMLLFGATMFSSYWINNSRLNVSQSQITEALSRAKSLGLRNVNGVTANQPAAFLSNENGTLKLCSDESCGSVIWQSELPPGVVVSVDGTTLTCMTFDNQGLPMSYSDCMQVSPGVQNYEITSSSAKAQGVL